MQALPFEGLRQLVSRDLRHVAIPKEIRATGGDEIRRVLWQKLIARQRELRRIVEVPVFLRGDPRHMRIGKTDSEEKGLLGVLRMLAQLLNGIRSRVAIQQFFVSAIDRFKSRHGAVATAFALLRNRDAFGPRICDELTHPRLRGGAGARRFAVPGRHGPRSIVVDANMIYFAEAAGVVAVVLEVLRHRGDVGHGGAQGATDLKDTRGSRIPPAEHRDPRR